MIEIDEGVFRPELTVQFLASNQFSRSFQQCDEYLKWLLLQLYFLPTLAEFSGREIDLKRTEADDSGCRGGGHEKFPGASLTL